MNITIKVHLSTLNVFHSLAVHFFMLLLTGRMGKSIVIQLPTGERIEVTVLGLKGNQARIGTDAPAEYTILREERVIRDSAN
jgi:carbon storage regulator